MNTIGYILIGAVVAFIIAMFFEETREYILEFFQNIPDLVGGLFEGIGEFSIAGLVVGAISAGFVFVLRNQMLNPFLNHMGPVEKIIWGIATYIACFVAGYLIGKKLLED